MTGLLIVSHSEEAAKGIAQIAVGMSGGGVEIAGVGGNDEGGLGVSVMKIYDELTLMLPNTDGVLIIPDLGSSVLSSRGAIEMLSPEDSAKVLIADAPILEGAMLGAVEASCGASLEQVAEAAQEARNLKKLDR